MQNRSFILAPLALLTLTSLITLGGCSSTTSPGDTSGGAGGTTGGTGSGAAPGSGGSVSAAGTGGTGTSSAGAGSVKMQPIPTLSDCPTLNSELTSGCAKLGCHQGPYASAKLDLTPDMGLVGRLKDVPANHTDITCAGNVVCTSIPAACPTGDKLVDSSNVANSWMLHKVNGMPNGCGDSMPPAGYSIDATGKACVISLINAIAALPN
ncbi:MAG TPA: hypothetical protein VMI54_10060 [Polyangiaceae bacterium]|nr:hypothetical protein [Polyangiaceae bacterium]